VQVDEDRFFLLNERKGRDQLWSVIVETYFPSDIRPVGIEQSAVNIQSYQYSKKLLRVAEPPALFGNKAGDSVRQKARDQYLRKIK